VDAQHVERQAGAERHRGVDGEQRDARLGRTEAAVTQAEGAEHRRLQVRVDREHEVGDHDQQAGR